MAENNITGKTLHAKQLQINSLLALTRAINNNTKAQDLYELFELFLRNQMNVEQMILYYHRDALSDATACAKLFILHLEKGAPNNPHF